MIPLFLFCAAVQEPDAAAILTRASAAYADVRTFAADFVQVIDNPMLGAPDTTRGRMWQQRPARFAMRFSQPKGDRIVADGRVLWLYTPSTTPGQAIRTRIPQTGGTGPNLIGQFVERPLERYTARWLRADSAAAGWSDVLALTPRDRSTIHFAAVVWVSRADAQVRRLEITEAPGQVRTIVLSRVVVNDPIPAAEFRFTPPAGTRIVDQ